MKAFTLYWLGGTRSVVYGENIETAFTLAGYGSGAVKAVDWYDEGITDTHYYVKTEGWKKYEPIHIHENDFDNFTQEQLVEFFNKRHTIIVDRENKDQITMDMTIGNYACIGWVKHIQFTYNEHHDGNYFDDEDSEHDHYYMVCNSVYYPAEEIEQAVDGFVQYVKYNKKERAISPIGKSLEEIKLTQKL